MGVARAAATRRITSTGAAGVEPELLSPSELLAGGQPTVRCVFVMWVLWYVFMVYVCFDL